MSKITLNIVEPGSSAPVVPDTGLFTHGVGGTETTIIISAVILLAVVAIILAVCIRKKVQILEIIKSRKRISAGLAAISLLVSACTFTAFTLTTGKSNTSAIEDNLTINTSDEEFTIELADEPVFAVLPVEITVEEATEAGYTLSAYAESTDLVSTTNPDDVIPMVTVEGDELTTLTDDTWGLVLDNKPTSKDQIVYTTLSTNQDDPTLIIDKSYEATDANDTTVIYYGFYITPDIPYGTYTGGNIEYEAEASKVATVTFDGNGLYFHNDPEQKQNVVKYIPGAIVETKYSHTPNLNDDGEVIDPNNDNGMYPLDSNETFVYNFPDSTNVYVEVANEANDAGCPSDSGDYYSFWAGDHPDYTAKANWESGIVATDSSGKHVFNRYRSVPISANVEGSAVTFAYTTSDSRSGYCGGSSAGYGYYAIITGYIPSIPISGDYEIADSSVSHRFLGWSEDRDATEPTYKTQDDIARSLDLTGGDVTLYAIYIDTLSILYDGNGADGTTNMNEVLQGTTNLDGGDRVDLLASNFQREGYGFVGWSTDPDAWDKLTDDDETNNSAIYGPNQTITIDEDLIGEAGGNRKLIMRAIWAPAEKDSQGQPVYLQDWTGCSNLDKTTYDSATNTLLVGKNTVTALTDSRDDSVYTIARLADGNCWMTENLRLDNSIANEAATSEFTGENTNNPSLPFTNNFEEQTTSNRLSVTSNEWCYNNRAECVNQSMLNTNNVSFATVTPVFNQDFTGQNNNHKNFEDSIVSYGNYYNWYSATTGRGKEENGNGTTVSGDICPASWQLPEGGRGNVPSGTFDYLNQQMNGDTSTQESNIWRSFPNNFILAGIWDEKSAVVRGNYGFYWTKTAANNSSAHSFYLAPWNIQTNDDRGKYRGCSVRCVILAE